MDDPVSKVIWELVKGSASDVIGPPAKQFGLILEDVVKCARLITFPLQCGAHLQDRLSGHIKKVMQQVPQEYAVSPPEEIMSPVFDKLRLFSPDSSVAEMYQNLLASAMDKRFSDKAHPAFIHIISQLSSDEALIVREMSLAPVRPYVQVELGVLDRYSPQADERNELLLLSSLDELGRVEFSRLVLKPELLLYPKLFLTYLDHLNSLGLVEFADPKHPGRIRLGFNFNPEKSVRCLNLSLTEMGQLFFSACMSK